MDDTLLRRRTGKKNTRSVSYDFASKNTLQPSTPQLEPKTVSNSMLSLYASVATVATQIAGQADFIRRELTHFWRLPHWLRDNEYLCGSHRPELQSFRECFVSIFRLHSETINIWTHLIGFFVFVFITLYTVLLTTNFSWDDKLVYVTYFSGVMICLGFSWLFHTVSCHSESISKLFNKLDYCGIAILIYGSFVPFIYYSFYCFFYWMIFYLLLISTLVSLAIIASLLPRFSSPEYRSIRAGLFVAIGLSGAFPAGHYVLLEGFWNAFQSAALDWLLLMAFLYICGAVIYTLRVPERWYPGKFDIWFQSHQIFHMLVLAGVFAHLCGINKIAAYRLSLTGKCLKP